MVMILRLKGVGEKTKYTNKDYLIKYRIGKMIRMIHFPFKTVYMLYMYDYGFFFQNFLQNLLDLVLQIIS